MPAIEISSLQPQLADFVLRPPRRPRASAPCRSQAATPPSEHAEDHQDEDQHEQRQRTRKAGCAGIERIERDRDDLPVGDREGDDDGGKRHKNEGRDDLAEVI